MTLNLQNTLNVLDSRQTRVADSTFLAWLEDANSDEVCQLLRGILELLSCDACDESSLARVIRNLQSKSVPWAAPANDSPQDLLSQLYLAISEESPLRHLPLALLASQRDADCLRQFAELLVEHPLVRPEALMEVFAPLMRGREADLSPLFPRLLDALQHPAAAAVVLDVANYLSVTGQIPEHPADGRRDQLLELFTRLIEQLERFEESSATYGVKDLEAAQKVTESIGLAISLSYALSLMNETRAIGGLNRMMDLSHRRLRVEAAAALARLQEQAGVETLVSLASEPSVRLTVLVYAQEQGLLEKIDPQFRSDLARAEAELVRMLSEPSHYGYPPSECELLESRELSWPSYDEPIECYLFKFSYTLPSGEHTNIGIAGPATHAFASDLSELPAELIFAAFAGWQTEHEEIQEIEIDPANPHQATEVERFTRRLSDRGFVEITPAFIGVFFGARSLIAESQSEGHAGFAIVSDVDFAWLPQARSSRSITPELAYSIYKGQQLLRTFNPDFKADQRTPSDQEESELG